MIHRHGFVTAVLALLSAVALNAQSQLRLVHATQGGPAIDVFIDGVASPIVPNLSYRQASAAVTVTSGQHRVTVSPTGFPAVVVLDTTFVVGPDTALTALTLGTIAAPGAALLPRKLSVAPGSGSALVRILNGSGDSGPVEFSIRNSAGQRQTFGVLSLGASTEYVSVPIGTITVDVNAPNGSLRYRATGTLLAGNIVTILANGQFSDASFLLNVVVDNNASAQIPLAALTAVQLQGKIRVVNVAQAVSSVRALLGASSFTIGDSLQFRHASASVAVTPIPTGVRVAPVVDPSNPLFTTTIDVNADSAYTVYAVGSTPTISPVVLSNSLVASPLPGQSRVRVLHASEDLGSVRVTLIDNAGVRTTLPDLSYKSSSTFASVPGGVLAIEVRTLVSNKLLYHGQTAINSGLHFTLIMDGLFTGPKHSFGVNALEDQRDSLVHRPMTLLNVIYIAQTTIRFVNVDPMSTNYEVRADGDISSIAGVMKYREQSPCVRMSPGSHSFAVIATNGSVPFTLLTPVLSVDSVYVVAVVRTNSSTSSALIVSSPDSVYPQPGHARIQFIHAATRAREVDVTLSATNADTLRSQVLGTLSRTVLVQGFTVAFRVKMTDDSFDQHRASGTIPQDALVILTSLGDEFDANIDSTAQLLVVPMQDCNGQTVLPSIAKQSIPQTRLRLLSVVLGGAVAHLSTYKTLKVTAQASAFVASPVVYLNEGTHVVTTKLFGTPNQTLQQTLSLSPDSNYALLVVESGPPMRTILLSSPATLDSESLDSRVRFLNVGSVVAPVNVTITDANSAKHTATGLPYFSSSQFFTLASGAVTAECGLEGSPPYYRGVGTIPARSIVTLIAVGANAVDSVFVLRESIAQEQNPLVKLSRVASTIETNDNARTGAIHSIRQEDASTIVTFDAQPGDPIHLRAFDVLGRCVINVSVVVSVGGRQRVTLPHFLQGNGVYIVSMLQSGRLLGSAKLVLVR